MLAAHTPKILVNLSDVSFLDSSGIGELVASKRLADQLGSSLKLMQIPERVQSTLRLSLILPLFQTFDSEGAALAAFGAAGERTAAS